MKKTAMVKFAKARLLLKLMKKGFVPMPGGMPTDPAMAGGAMPPPGAAPMPAMDPSVMGAYAAPPMGGDPMGGGMPPVDPATGMPMDPAMMGGAPAAMGGGGEMPMEPTIAELPISMFQELMADTMMQIMGGEEGGGEEDNVEPSSEGPTNAEVMERLTAMEDMLGQLVGGGGGGMPPEGESPMMMGGVGPGGGMMGAGSMPQGLEVSAGARPKPGLADLLVDSALIAVNTEK